ncbi:MAG TPA: D-glycero-beta-D-manno-heptose 1-phosphate adenylyltransferase, partial [Chitinophagaceae bacterium]|nr:D-glycero-beta-D-manno-heptose 1-phosphate adenylyltransferase [Chitinophagaceae bacterium]
MRPGNSIAGKIVNEKELFQKLNVWRLLSKTIAFTNGCFDILHGGHIASLTQAAQCADILIVGVNADSSVKKIKGENRPVNDEKSRMLLLASLAMVDAVIIFSEETPLELIKKIEPDVLVKGGDYSVEQVAGAKEVISRGGKVILNPIVDGFSTTSIIQ